MDGGVFLPEPLDPTWLKNRARKKLHESMAVIIPRYEAGESYCLLAEEFEVSAYLLRNALEAYGIKIRNPGGGPLAERQDYEDRKREAATLRAQKVPMNTIADKLGVSRERARQLSVQGGYAA
jgi:hypothetical protein